MAFKSNDISPLKAVMIKNNSAFDAKYITTYTNTLIIIPLDLR